MRRQPFSERRATCVFVTPSSVRNDWTTSVCSLKSLVTPLQSNDSSERGASTRRHQAGDSTRRHQAGDGPAILRSWARRARGPLTALARAPRSAARVARRPAQLEPLQHRGRAEFARAQREVALPLEVAVRDLAAHRTRERASVCCRRPTGFRAGHARARGRHDARCERSDHDAGAHRRLDRARPSRSAPRRRAFPPARCTSANRALTAAAIPDGPPPLSGGAGWTCSRSAASGRRAK